MANFLVVTAMGTDRPGIVNELTKIVTQTNCNIVDSRLAVFGNEFTLILLLSGEWNAITRFEADLSVRSAQLELVTLMKRTSEHKLINYSGQVSVKLDGEDAPGCIGQFTEYLASRSIDLSSFRTKAKSGYQQIEMLINITDEADYADLQEHFEQLAEQLKLSIRFEHLEQH
ncbi:glycine cleavage system protein R [Psychrobium sp. 1_MG-2023]|uniref:glycine cleavage system protein R n=1 Tax=Psychrobium sp. 1_MG-2023 TaxID=3062624 RepID=UPI000C322737|nr:ACT domain-containing protein [Psychrobium sp. 1_MG-2023]MDP2562422.1 ACT domain-containing protein [Psychrobium sp. 1_MG-2023]PKF56150.1 glycine cleavage system transcriptional repressor [Alteromonadales bacterium alter-6D02]